MAGFGLFDRVHGESAQCVRHAVMARARGNCMVVLADGHGLRGRRSRRSEKRFRTSHWRANGIAQRGSSTRTGGVKECRLLARAAFTGARVNLRQTLTASPHAT